MDPLVYVIILNYNGWGDTLECLESVYRLTYPNFKIIVCDNNSNDGSLQKILNWADGKLESYIIPNSPFYAQSKPPIKKPLSYNFTKFINGDFSPKSLNGSKLTIIDTNHNFGYAGGNNIGIKYAQKDKSFEYAWILNNDTVVDSKALAHLIEAMKKNPAIGICGSKLAYYYFPEQLQALGGAKYNPWLAKSIPIMAFESIYKKVDTNTILKKMDYIIGASMLLSKNLLHTVGLLNDEYFLYYEEIDITLRAKESFQLGVAPHSLVFHKEGGTTGSATKSKKKSAISEYFFTRNRILFTKKFFPKCLPTVYLAIFLSLFKRLLSGNFDLVKVYFKALTGRSL